jgi:hypothetical protein
MLGLINVKSELNCQNANLFLVIQKGLSLLLSSLVAHLIIPPSLNISHIIKVQFRLYRKVPTLASIGCTYVGIMQVFLFNGYQYWFML